MLQRAALSEHRRATCDEFATPGDSIRLCLHKHCYRPGMGLLRRNRSAQQPIAITADDLYEAAHHVLVAKAPSLVPTITPFGVMVHFLPTTALVLNLSGEHWAIGMYETSNAPKLVHVRTISTTITALDTGELIVSVLERCNETYADVLKNPAFAADEAFREWITVRRDEVVQSLTPN